MKVLKFGGTSVGSSESIRNVKNIINSVSGKKLIVLSAMSGVTNELVRITEYFKSGNQPDAGYVVKALKIKHEDLTDALFPSQEENLKIKSHISNLFDGLNGIIEGDFSENAEAKIMTFGETVLTYIFSGFLQSSGIKNNLLDAKKFMQVSNLENPDTEKVGRLFQQYIKGMEDNEIYITQG
ncbi:MAG: aspartate kinase, partial [Flavobacteriaceae bacterium]|nr:aspartate kinase [Flavobacteriaceae bacterium]